VEQPRRHELALFVLLTFAISWAMQIPLALATLLDSRSARLLSPVIHDGFSFLS
jgi:hypothetical protein